ncbi:hypothetical protein PPYR_00082 [Photinus pyralis]|uniref:Uncharacterized protein n=1 Tax=Photinus pyralis TaxID=7054 RepID=A0A5N4B0J0_PHOPY|nr:hypothetical protein PPYR_00082 [Photinus pyralis]
MMMAKKPRTKITLLKPSNLENKSEEDYRERTVEYENNRRINRNLFLEGEYIWAYEVKEKKWIPGKIMKAVGEYTYLVLASGRVRYMHGDHLKKRSRAGMENEIVQESKTPESTSYLPPALPLPEVRDQVHMPEMVGPRVEDEVRLRDGPSTGPPPEGSTEAQPVVRDVPSPSLRRSKRTVIPPNRLNL